MSKKESPFLRQLREYVDSYMPVLEGMFGPRDNRFEFRAIGRSTHPRGGPQTLFPFGYYQSGGCLVDIQISQRAYDRNSLDQSIWQVAHECVHLLDPCCQGMANILEEGLATWFQDEQKYHPDIVRTYIRKNSPHSPRYTEAKQLVAKCMPDLQFAVKKLRASGFRLTDFDSVDLATCMPRIDDCTITRLCEKFSICPYK